MFAVAWNAWTGGLVVVVFWAVVWLAIRVAKSYGKLKD